MQRISRVTGGKDSCSTFHNHPDRKEVDIGRKDVHYLHRGERGTHRMDLGLLKAMSMRSHGQELG